MIDFSKFLNLNYWFSGTPTDFYWWKYVAAVFILLLIVGFVARILSKKKKLGRSHRKLMLEIKTPFFIFGIIGLILTFFRYEGVKYLSIRFFFLLLLLSFVAWLAYTIFKIRVMYPRVECEYKGKEDENKYRPTSKKKKNKHKKK